MSDGGKGSAQRPYDHAKFNENFDRIFSKPYFCSECGKPCCGVDRDFGYGQTEAWGAISTHTNIHTVSECCDGDLLDEPPTEGEDDE